jgi:cobalt-precorrin 5A hydrolase / precorrin-3B C17-methyltransferase
MSVTDCYFEKDCSPIFSPILEPSRLAPTDKSSKLQGHSRVLWVGIGCGRGVTAETIAQAIHTVFRSHHLASEAIAGLASLDRKANEAGLLEFCHDRALPLRLFSAEQLNAIAVPHPSQTVAAQVVTPSVAEAAAILASDRGQLRVSKQIFRLNGKSIAVTIAIAEAQAE